jgi:hypothetical protein
VKLIFIDSWKRSAEMNSPITSSDAVDRIELPSDLSFAITHGSRVMPVFSHNRNAVLPNSQDWSPTADPDQVGRWIREYSYCNWAMATGTESGVIVLELHTGICRGALEYLCGDSWTWPQTLEFRSGNLAFLLFRHPGTGVRKFGPEWTGITVHSEDLVLIPPSWFLSAPALQYDDLAASIADAPEWLRADGGSGPSGTPTDWAA